MLPFSRWPRVREPITKSASPHMIGAISRALCSAASLPSPSMNTITVAPRAAACAAPVAQAWP